MLATGIPVLDRGGFFARLPPRRSYAGRSWSVERAGHVPVERRGDPLDPVEAVGGRRVAPGRRQRSRDGSPRPVAGATAGRAGRLGARDVPRDRGAVPLVGPGLRERARAPVRRPAHAGERADPRGHGARQEEVQQRRRRGGRPQQAGARRTTALGGRVHRLERPRAGALPSALAFNGEVALRLGSGWLRPIGRGDEFLHEGQGEVHYDGVHPVQRPASVDEQDPLGVRGLPAPARRTGLERRRAGLGAAPLHGSRFAPDGTLLEGPATCATWPLDDRSRHRAVGHRRFSAASAERSRSASLTQGGRSSSLPPAPPPDRSTPAPATVPPPPPPPLDPGPRPPRPPPHSRVPDWPAPAPPLPDRPFTVRPRFPASLSHLSPGDPPSSSPHPPLLRRLGRKHLSVGLANAVMRFGFTAMPAVYDALVGRLFDFAATNTTGLSPQDRGTCWPPCRGARRCTALGADLSRWWAATSVDGSSADLVPCRPSSRTATWRGPHAASTRAGSASSGSKGCRCCEG